MDPKSDIHVARRDDDPGSRRQLQRVAGGPPREQLESRPHASQPPLDDRARPPSRYRLGRPIVVGPADVHVDSKRIAAVGRQKARLDAGPGLPLDREQDQGLEPEARSGSDPRHPLAADGRLGEPLASALVLELQEELEGAWEAEVQPQERARRGDGVPLALPSKDPQARLDRPRVRRLGVRQPVGGKRSREAGPSERDNGEGERYRRPAAARR